MHWYADTKSCKMVSEIRAIHFLRQTYYIFARLQIFIWADVYAAPIIDY